MSHYSTPVRLYRGEALPAGSVLSEWLRQALVLSGIAAAQGRWFTQDLAIARWYRQEAGADGRLIFIDVPVDVYDKYRVVNQPAALSFSRDPLNEVFLPRELAAQAQLFQEDAL